MRRRKPQPKREDRIPSAVAVAATFQTGAGKHGGSPKVRNRRDRRDAKLECKEQR